MVLGRKVRGQQADGGQVHGVLREPFQDDGEPPGGASGLDAPVRRVRGEVQHLHTIREQRRAAFGEVQAPCVQLRQVGDEHSRRLALARGEGFHPGHQRLVGEASHGGEHMGIHGPCIPSGFRTPQERPGCQSDRSGASTSLESAGAALGRFWHTTAPSTHDSSRAGRSRSKTRQVPRSCDENGLVGATRSGPSCEANL